MKRAVLAGLAVLTLAVAGALVVRQQRRSSPAYQLEQQRAEVEIKLRLGDQAGAARALARVLELAPDDLDSLLRLAGVQEALGESLQAEATLRRGLAGRPGDLRLLVALGHLLQQASRMSEVVVLLAPHLQAIEAHGEARLRTAAMVLLGEALATVGQVERGLALLREATDQREKYGLHAPSEVSTGDARVIDLLALGRVLSAAGRWKEAEAPLRRARQIAPDGLGVNLALADVLDRLGRPGESVELLRSLYEAHQESRLDLGPPLGEFLVRAEQLAAAHELADALAAQGGERGLGAAAYVRGLVALAKGELGEARAQFQEMARQLPRSAQARLLQARVETLAGDAAAARAGLEGALAIAPGLPEAEVGLLELDERQGDHASVRVRALRLLASPAARPQAVRRLLALYAQDRDARPAQKRLRELRAASPEDLSLRLFAALFGLLGDEPDQGAKELAALAGHPGVDLEQAFGLLASAREGGGGDAQEAIDLLAWIASQEPRLAPARVVLASTYERVGRVDLALRELDQALDADPGLHAARRARARLLARQGELARAVADLEQLRTVTPDDGKLLTELAELHVRRGEVPQALPLLEHAAQLAPEEALAQARLGRAQALAGSLRSALKCFAAARRFDPKLPAAHQDAAVHLVQGDVQAAADAWRRARTETGDLRLSEPLACALALLGQPAPALAELGESGGSPSAELLRALLRHLAGDTRAGLAQLERLGAPPEVQSGLQALDLTRARPSLEACALNAVGWAPEVRARANGQLEEARPNPFLVYFLATFPAIEADPDLQLRLGRRLAELVRGDAGPGLVLADAQRRAGDEAQELGTLEELFARFPEDRAVALRLGMALERRGEKARALELYARAATDGGGGASPSPVALNNLAYLLGDDPTRRSLAVEYGRRAARLAPRNGQVRDTLGWLLFLDGQWVDAERVLTEAVALDPARPTLRWHLAQVLEARGARARAQNHLRVALLSSQSFPERAEAQALLDRLSEELRPPAGAPLELAPGASLEVATGEQGLARLRIPAGEGSRVVSLSFQAPPGCAANLLVAGAGGEVRKRLEAAPGETISIPRFTLDPQGADVIVRVDARHSGASVHLGLGAPAQQGETEPDDDPAQAALLQAGAELRGRLDGLADRDHLRLQPGPSRAAGLTVTAGPRAALRLELLGGGGGEGRSLRVCRIEPGSEARLDPLATTGDSLLLRISPATPLAAGVAEGEAWDWSVRLQAVDPVEGPDREPNDHPEDAARVAPGELRGRIGPGDAVDWVRLAAAPGECLSLELRAGAEAGLAVQLWEQQSAGLLPRRLLELPPGAGLRIPRWRVPATGELLVSVSPGPGAGATWSLTATAAGAAADQETEPDDQVGEAGTLPSGATWHGALDVPGDRDWLRCPPQASGALRLALRAGPGAPALEGASLGVYAASPAGPALLARFVARARELEVPALRVPPGSELLLLLSGPPGRALGAYELVVGEAVAGPGAELEPNDDPARASALTEGAALTGLLSGERDRDLLRVEGARAVRVQATGSLPISVVRLGAGGGVKLVNPGQTVRLETDGRGATLFELSLPPEAPPEAGGAPWRVEREE